MYRTKKSIVTENSVYLEIEMEGLFLLRKSKQLETIKEEYGKNFARSKGMITEVNEQIESIMTQEFNPKLNDMVTGFKNNCEEGLQILARLSHNEIVESLETNKIKRKIQLYKAAVEITKGKFQVPHEITEDDIYLGSVEMVINIVMCCSEGSKNGKA